MPRPRCGGCGAYKLCFYNRATKNFSGLARSPRVIARARLALSPFRIPRRRDEANFTAIISCDSIAQSLGYMPWYYDNWLTTSKAGGRIWWSVVASRWSGNSRHLYSLTELVECLFITRLATLSDPAGRAGGAKGVGGGEIETTRCSGRLLLARVEVESPARRNGLQW